MGGMRHPISESERPKTKNLVHIYWKLSNVKWCQHKTGTPKCKQMMRTAERVSPMIVSNTNYMRHICVFFNEFVQFLALFTHKQTTDRHIDGKKQHKRSVA